MYGRYTSAVEQLCHGKACRGGVPFVGHRQVSKSFRFICDADGAGKPPGPAHFLSLWTFVHVQWSPVSWTPKAEPSLTLLLALVDNLVVGFDDIVGLL